MILINNLTRYRSVPFNNPPITDFIIELSLHQLKTQKHASPLMIPAHQSSERITGETAKQFSPKIEAVFHVNHSNALKQFYRISLRFRLFYSSANFFAGTRQLSTSGQSGNNQTVQRSHKLGKMLTQFLLLDLVPLKTEWNAPPI